MGSGTRTYTDQPRCTAVAFLALTAAASSALQCSRSTKDKLTNFFFEVPPPAASQTVAGTPPRAPTVPAKPESFASIHPPFADRKCMGCHREEQQMRINEEFMTDCADCHEDYFGDRVGHPPVKKLECMKCHEPHVSAQPGLLKRTLFRTCMQCHKKPESLSEEMHTRPDVENCTLCHDPHFGEGYRIKKTAPIADEYKKSTAQRD